MKNVGIVFIAIGLALLLYVGYYFIKENNKIASPIPDEKGVKVIFVTPTSSQ